jgi:hypothetical protein
LSGRPISPSRRLNAFYRSLRAIGLEDHAQRCEQADDLTTAKAAAHAAAYAASIASGPDVISAASIAACHAAAAAAYAAAAYAPYAAANAYAAYSAWAPREEIFRIAVAILDEAIKLGNQAEPIEMALVVSRIDSRAKADKIANGRCLPKSIFIASTN